MDTTTFLHSRALLTLHPALLPPAVAQSPPPRYEDPLPLCETPSGWEWSGAGKARWGLLGDVIVRAEKKVALPAGLAG